MSKPIKNMSASVHERLMQRARQDQRPFNEVLQYFAMERFLYRWSKSPHVKSFILKGALMLRVWNASEFRSTKDIDMLGSKTSNDPESIANKIKEIIAIEVDVDGLVFLSDSVTAEKITEDAEYEGVRVNFIGRLGNAKVHMQVDVGFGDIVYPEPQDTELPSMLGFPQAHLLCYSRESAIAEKFQAMIYLGDANSRMKDFYDIWTLSRQFDFRGQDLAEALRLTFHQRNTQIPAETNLFTKEFIELKQVQWKAFHKKLNLDHIPEVFGDITTGIEKFLVPVIQTLLSNGKVSLTWTSSGPWV